MKDQHNTEAQDSENETLATQPENDTTEKVEETETEQPNTEELLSAEKDKFLRLFAEFENYKKRTQKEKLDLYKYANQELMTVLLPVVDDFERALKQLDTPENKETLEGIKLIQNKLNNTLKDKGLEKIEVNIGDTLDVEFHEAITQIPAPTDELKNKIVDVIETGYKISDRVIRFTKVVTGK